MTWVAISLLVLAICDPFVLDAKKVVLMIPRHVRRTHSTPWRHLMQLKKHGLPNHGYPGQRYGHPQGPQFHQPKQLHFNKDQYPPGGDDFDQGFEEVNHVRVPHGKGITHAVSFGNGYIPFDTYKDHNPSSSPHHNYKPEGPTSPEIGYGPPMTFPSPSYAPAYLSQQADAYIKNDDESQYELQDRSHDRTGQKTIPGKVFYVSSKSPGNDGPGRYPGPSSHDKIKPGGVYAPAGIPSATLGGSKHGIVLRDSIAFDDYNRKLNEFKKNWPVNFGSNNNLLHGGIVNFQQGSLQHLDGVSRQFDGIKFPSPGFPGVSGYTASLSQDQSQGQQGYAVKEDIEEAPHDFRTMPIQTAPVQSAPLQTLQQSVQQIIHQQPVQQSLQHFITQPQLPSQVPVNYALSSFQGYVHG